MDEPAASFLSPQHAAKLAGSALGAAARVSRDDPLVDSRKRLPIGVANSPIRHTGLQRNIRRQKSARLVLETIRKHLAP